MWSVGVFGLRSKPLRPGVLCPSKPRRIGLGMRFILFLVASQSKGVGNGEDEDEARARAALAEVASAERGVKRMPRRQCKRTSSGAWIHGTEFRRRRQRLWHHRAKQPRYFLAEKSEAENENQTLDQLDPKTGGQSQLKQLEAKIKEQMQQLQSQV